MASSISAILTTKTPSRNAQIAPIISENLTKTYEDIFECEYNLTQSIELKYHDIRHDYTLEGHDNWISSIAITADSKFVVSASTDNTIKI